MKKVLVIEDNHDILSNTAEMLELSHYKVFTADNGKEGVELALSNKPDLILCDIMMPGLDGYGVLHMIQQNPDLRGIPFIFLSAKTDQSDIRKGMNLGADDYILKPFDTTELLNAIEIRLRKAELTRQHFTEGLKAAGDLISVTRGERTLAEFLDGRQIENFKKKQRIFSEGNHPIKLFFIQKGRVKIFKMNDDGKELILRIVNKGDFFGYLALLEDSLYKASAEALEDTEIATVPKAEFDELINSHPEVKSMFVKILARDVVDKEEQLLHIAYNSLRRKVADALISICKKFKDSLGKCVINLSRENLAAVAGTATESLIRTLTDFKDEKIIDIKDGKVVVLDFEKLQRMVN